TRNAKGAFSASNDSHSRCAGPAAAVRVRLRAAAASGSPPGCVRTHSCTVWFRRAVMVRLSLYIGKTPRMKKEFIGSRRSNDANPQRSKESRMIRGGFELDQWPREDS